MGFATNPILPGFHPDPSIIRVGEWYYLANSTFEWWPGVRIHKSKDLGNWELVGHALTRKSQLDLRGVPESGGVWAPALSHADGLFWLIYSDVKAFNGVSKDVRNYLVTASRIEGPWSDPVSLNSSGFDPSLFHDDDGTKWLVCQLWDPRPGKNPFAGITLQRFDVGSGRLVGTASVIFKGSPLGVVEGPHVYKRGGYYYLVTAEGGTGWQHAVTVARSRSLQGPYEVAPHNPILTAYGHPESEFKKAGHASLVEAPDGKWFMVHLCSRTVGKSGRCVLGRETALQSIDWPLGGWPKLSGKGNAPRARVSLAGVRTGGYADMFVDEFDKPDLDKAWSVLREPHALSWLSLTERKGYLRLRGRHSLLSSFDQSLVGFRLLHHHCSISTRLEFFPEGFQQTAGLALYYNTTNFHYLYICGTEDGGRELRLLCGDVGTYCDPAPQPVPLPRRGTVELEAEVSGHSLQFYYSCAGILRETVGPALDMTLLSDDRVIEGGSWGFTGCFAALCAQDSGDSGIPADFDWFGYYLTKRTSKRQSNPRELAASAGSRNT